MNEVEKMYSNAGVRPKYIDACTVEDKYWQNKELANEYGTFDMYMNAKCGHQEDCTTLCSCAYTKEEYPPFTTEKQIELIKILMGQEDFSWTIVQQGKNTEYAFYVGYEYSSEGFKEFTEALADLVNEMWQDLTDTDKVQIKEILSE